MAMEETAPAVPARVELITFPNCENCTMTRNHLDRHRIKYTVVLYDPLDPDQMDFMSRNHLNTLPIVRIEYPQQPGKLGPGHRSVFRHWQGHNPQLLEQHIINNPRIERHPHETPDPA